MVNTNFLKNYVRGKKMMKMIVFCLSFIAISILSSNSWAFSGSATAFVDGIGSFNVLAFEQNLIQSANVSASSGGRASSQRAIFSDVYLQISPNDNIPKLLLYCAKGQHIPEVIIDFTSSLIKLDDVIVSSTNWSEEDGFSGVQIGLKYGRIYWSYGDITTGWDLETNKEQDIEE